MTSKKGILFLLLSLSVTLFSCDKDEIIPAPDPSLGKLLQVQFTEQTIPLNNVDSVFAYFKIPGTANILKRKMIATGNFYSTSIQDISPASYDAEIRVYAKKEPGVAYNYMYRINLSFLVPLQQTTVIKGPDGKYSSNWKPNFLFNNEEKKVKLIVAERVDDPFFEIIAPQITDYKLTGLIRSTFGGNPNVGYLADMENWISPNNPLTTGIYTNEAFFGDFAQRMQSKQWYKAEISFHLEYASPNIVHFDLTYYPRP